MSAAAPIGFFDSGVGGLSVWRAVTALLPRESTTYVADSAHCPYGPRPAAEIRELARARAAALVAAGCKMVVVACNTATAAAIDDLRAAWPRLPFVGMEPAVKPAALRTRSGVVGVLATEGTFQGRLYRETRARFAAGTRVVACVADELVGLVERGDFSSPAAERAVRAYAEPLLAAGADHLVLGCTHFAFLAPLVGRIAAGRAVVVEPSAAVARQVRRVLAARGLLAPSGARAAHDLSTTGDRRRFRAFLRAAGICAGGTGRQQRRTMT